jgi:hypothetical protein
MKLLVSGIALVASISAFGQALPSGSVPFSVLEGSSNRVIVFFPLKITFLLSPFSSPRAFFAGPRWIKATMDSGKSNNKADTVLGSSDLVELRGNVEIKTDSALVQADEVDYHLATGEMELRGNVRLKYVVPQ